MKDLKGYTRKEMMRGSHGSSKNLLQLLLLRTRQARREFDLDANDKVASIGGLLRLRHAKVRVSFCPCWTGRAATANVELFAVNGLYGSSPAGEGFFKVEFDGVLDIVAFAGEEGMCFLSSMISAMLIGCDELSELNLPLTQ
jgi:hypothetical protein